MKNYGSMEYVTGASCMIALLVLAADDNSTPLVEKYHPINTMANKDMAMA
jgi:hypothetical protein